MSALLAVVVALASLVDQGAAEVKKGHLREAHALFGRAVAERPADGEALAWLGFTTLEFQRDEGAAEQRMERAVELSPKSSRAFLLLGAVLARRIEQSSIFGKIRLAPRLRRAFERAVELDPSSTDARLALLRFGLHAPSIAGGGLDKARAQAEAIGRLDPLAGALAKAEIAAHEGEDAASLLERAYELAKTAEGRGAALAALGQLALTSGRPVEAAAHFRREVRELPQEAAPRARLASALLAKGDPGGSLAAAREAVARDPLLPAAQESLSLAAAATGHPEEAAAARARLAELAPEHRQGQ